MEELSCMDRFCCNPLHLFKYAHCEAICFSPCISSSYTHMEFCIFMFLCKCKSTLVIIFSYFLKYFRHLFQSINKLLILWEFSVVFHESCTKCKILNINLFNKIIIGCCSVFEHIIGILSKWAFLFTYKSDYCCTNFFCIFCCIDCLYCCS